MTALTNTAIDALPPGGSLKDDKVPGLQVRAYPSGKSFLLYYRTRTGQERRPKIGDCAVVTLSQARDLARAMLLEVAAGRDPQGQRGLERIEPTLDQLWERCAREHYNGGRRWDYDARRLYKANIGPRMGDKRVRALGYADVQAMHQAMRATPIEANRSVAILSRMMGLAERWELRDLGTNPCQHLERFPERKRRRYAKPAEVRTFGPLLEREAEGNPSGVAFIYLLMFSGARPSEIENGTPDMIERVEPPIPFLPYGVLRLEKGKTGERDIYLPPQAMAVIDRLDPKRERLAGRTRLPRKLWNRLREEAGCPDLWARDWRRTFATQALSSGVSLSMVGELLGHQSVQTTKVYAKLMEDPAHAAAAGVASRMAGLLAGGA